MTSESKNEQHQATFTTFTDDYKARGSDWSDSKTEVFESKALAEKYITKQIMGYIVHIVDIAELPDSELKTSLFDVSNADNITFKKEVTDSSNFHNLMKPGYFVKFEQFIAENELNKGEFVKRLFKYEIKQVYISDYESDGEFFVGQEEYEEEESDDDNEDGDVVSHGEFIHVLPKEEDTQKETKKRKLIDDAQIV